MTDDEAIKLSQDAVEEFTRGNLGRPQVVDPRSGDLTDSAKATLIAAYRHALRVRGLDVHGPIYAHFDRADYTVHFTSLPYYPHIAGLDDPTVKVGPR